MPIKPAKYRKRPVVIEAMRWEWDTMPDVLAWVGEHGHQDPNVSGQLVIHTLEGDVWAKLGDYVIKGVAGEYYPCRADIFEATYEAVAQ